MFNIKLKVIPNLEPSILTFTDGSTADETILSAKLTITKTDLIEKEYPFSSPFTVGAMTQDIDFLDKDYALNVEYSVITNVGTYTKIYEFVTLGYSNLIKKNRLFVDLNDLSLTDKESFRKETIDINYFRMVAKDRCRFSDLIGAQQALDHIAEIYMNSRYTKCIC